LAVHDLAGSTDYFVNVLGFAKDWDDPGNRQAVVRGSVRVMLGACLDALLPAAIADHNYFGFIWTDDVDQLHREFFLRGADILFDPVDRSWGWREMGVAKPEGHRMMFATWIG
jgi:hypothetical protein